MKYVRSKHQKKVGENQIEMVLRDRVLQWDPILPLFLRPQLRGTTKCYVGLHPAAAPHPAHLYIYSNLTTYESGDPAESLREWGEATPPVLWPETQKICIFTRRNTDRVKMMYVKFTKKFFENYMNSILAPRRYNGVVRFISPHLEIWIPLYGYK